MGNKWVEKKIKKREKKQKRAVSIVSNASQNNDQGLWN